MSKKFSLFVLVSAAFMQNGYAEDLGSNLVASESQEKPFTEVSPQATFETLSDTDSAKAEPTAEPKSEKDEMVLEVKAKRRMIEKASSASKVTVNQESIQKLPQGDQVRLSKLIATTTPGVVEGPFGALFVRGNHAQVQYQIDGVQLPDSPSNTFAEPFSPRNIDHMEITTGGIPAEYGEKLAAVVSITSKSGPETPGGSAEINYGTYNRFSPQVIYGGSNEEGNFHYYFSANYFRTDRGLDTPQPINPNDTSQGGKDSIHNQGMGHNQFVKLDWQKDNENKFTLIASNFYTQFQIPNYPSSFKPTDPVFTQTEIPYMPADRNNWQAEYNDFLEVVWKHTLSSKSFFQVAPYWKYSNLNYNNDPAKDLNSENPHVHEAASFYEARHTNTLGLKADYSSRLGDDHKLKTGIQVQAARAAGTITIQKAGQNPYDASDPTTGYSENVYIQDEYTINKYFNLNAGLRFTATQFVFSGLSTQDSLLQPRVGLNYLPTDTTKFHIFYGRLFMPAPVENLRLAFNALTDIPPQPYDIKAEKDHYFEWGVDQQLSSQLVSLNVYYKIAQNMLDDAALLGTSLSQPYNYDKGYAYGAELSVKGKINEDWSNYVNYSYGIAKGQGISGGLFAVPKDEIPVTEQFLDHVQVHTLSSGLTYAKNNYWSTLQLMYGSGLRTGPRNSQTVSPHFVVDTTVGYEFKKDLGLLSNSKLSLDVLNVLDNAYPITLANGFTGTRYAAGRQFIVHLVKSF